MSGTSRRQRAKKRRLQRRLKRVGAVTAVIVVIGAVVAGVRLGMNDPERRANQSAVRAADYVADGDFKSAVIEYKNVVSVRPNDAEVRAALGHAYVALDAHSAAVKEFVKARDLGLRSDDLDRAIVKALAETGRIDDALDELEALEARGVDVSDLEVVEAEARLREGDLDKAREQFEAVLQSTPDSVEALLGVARLSAAEGDFDLANEKLDEALAVDPGNEDVLLLKGQIALTREQPETAADYLERAAESTRPVTRLAAVANLVRARILMNDLDAAQAALARAGGSVETVPEFMFYRAVIPYLRGDRETAGRHFTDLLNVRPDHPQGLLLSSQIKYAEGEYGIAEERLTRLVEMAPDYLPARRLLAATQLELKKPDSAIATLEHFDPETIEDGTFFELLGSAHLAVGHTDLGNRYLERAGALGADSSRVGTKLAVGALARGDVDEAMARLDEIGDAGGGAVVNSMVVYALIAESRTEEARKAATRLAEAAPSDPLPENLLGVIALKEKDHETARAHFERARALDPSFLPTYVNLAELELVLGKPDAARAVLDEALAIDDGEASVYMMQARIEAVSGDSAAALEALKTAARKDTSSLKARVMAATLLLEFSRSDEALEYAREAYALAPEDANVMMLTARAELAQGNAEAARPLYEALERRHADDANVRYLSAQFDLIDRDVASAREKIAALTRDVPRHRPGLVLGFRLALGAGDTDAAAGYLEAFRAIDPDSAAADGMAGELARARGEPEAAAGHFQAAFDKRGDTPSMLSLWQARRAAGDMAGASRLIEGWLEEHPGDLSARLQYATALIADGDRPAAIAEYETIIEQRPDNVVVLNNLAYLYQTAGDARALDYAKRAYEAAPDLFQTQDTYGWLLVEAGEVERGMELLERAQARAPTNPDVNYHYASALARAGYRDEARTYLSLALDSAEPFESRQAAEELMELL